MKQQSRLKQLLLEQFTERNAHITFEDAIKGLTYNDAGIRPKNLPHSIWELAEHVRIAQRDIIDFSRNPDYQAPSWPDDYWPSLPEPADQGQWAQTLEVFYRDKKEMADFILQTDQNLMEPLAHGDGQTLFRELMLIVDHNSYHIGQIVQVRRLLGKWN